MLASFSSYLKWKQQSARVIFSTVFNWFSFSQMFIAQAYHGSVRMSRLKKLLTAEESNYIYFRPGLGKSVLLTEVFLAKDRVPVGTRSAAKKTEVSKTDFVSPRVEMYLPYAVIRVINLLIEMFHVCTSLLTIVVWENQNDLGQFRFPNTLTIMPRRAEMLSQNFPTARANAKGISRHMVKDEPVSPGQGEPWLDLSHVSVMLNCRFERNNTNLMCLFDERNVSA